MFNKKNLLCAFAMGYSVSCAIDDLFIRNYNSLVLDFICISVPLLIILTNNSDKLNK